MTMTPTRIDDLNLSRLNLIVALDHVETQEWAVEMESAGRIVRISCAAGVKSTVPHGLDSDVSAALINLFIEQGLPEDGRLSVSATTLLLLCGWHRTGRYFASLRECLERLHMASYSVSGGWRDFPNRRWTHAKFHFIESLSFSSVDGVGQFDERSMISLRLADDVIASLRGGYVKPLDTEFMSSLSRPRTRVLYRVLDAARFDPEDAERKLNVLTVNVLQWGDQCKIPSEGKAWRVLRALEAPHEELVKRGYLKPVTLSGRGRTQQITYEFVESFVQLDPALSRRLRAQGVADGVARKLVQERGVPYLTECLNRFDVLVASGVLVVKKSRAAALMHLIANPDSYPYPAEKVPTPPARTASRMEPLLAEPTPQEDFAGLSPERAAERLLKRLGVYYRTLLPVVTQDALRHAVLEGALDPGTVLQEAIAAVGRQQRAEFVAELRTRLLDT